VEKVQYENFLTSNDGRLSIGRMGKALASYPALESTRLKEKSILPGSRVTQTSVLLNMALWSFRLPLYEIIKGATKYLPPITPGEPICLDHCRPLHTVHWSSSPVAWIGRVSTRCTMQRFCTGSRAPYHTEKRAEVGTILKVGFEVV